MSIITKANYIKHPIPSLNGNPLSEALPSPVTQEELIQRVRKQITCDGFWELEEFYQHVVLQDIAVTHIPSARFYSFYQKCLSLLLHSYSSRNPFSPESMSTKMALAADLHKKLQVTTLSHANLNTSAPSVLVAGLSGAGKTTMIRNALACIPQTIQHTEYEGKKFNQIQIVWLSIDMPSTSSLKALALNFFKAVDEATGSTTYFSDWEKRNRDSVERHIVGMQSVAANHEIGLVHIDELQFMLSYAKSANSPSLTVLDSMFNKIGIPIILSCTDLGLQLFETAKFDGKRTNHELTTLRRVLKDREFQLKNYSLDSSSFNDLLDALYPASLLLNCASLSESFKSEFYNLTAGLPAFMSRLAQLHHEALVYMFHKSRDVKAISTNDIKILCSIHKSQFHLFEKAIAYLISGDIRAYEKQLENAEPIDGVSKNKEKEDVSHSQMYQANTGNTSNVKAPIFNSVHLDDRKMLSAETPFPSGIKE